MQNYWIPTPYCLILCRSWKSLVWSAVPLGIRRLQLTASWSAATCASVWSCEYLAGLRAVALATGTNREISLRHTSYHPLHRRVSPLPSPRDHHHHRCLLRRSGHPISTTVSQILYHYTLQHLADAPNSEIDHDHGNKFSTWWWFDVALGLEQKY